MRKPDAQGRISSRDILPLASSADGGRQARIAGVRCQQDADQDVVGHRREQHHDAVNADGQSDQAVISGPGSDPWDEGEPEQEVQIGPKYGAIDALHGLQQVMMIVPVDAQEDEAESVDQQLGDKRLQAPGA